MQKFESTDEILGFAINEEEEAARFYSQLADSIDGPISQVLQDFAKEDRGLFLEDQGPERYLDLQISGRLAGAVGPLSVTSSIGDVPGPEP